jgi:hypothetical protein
MNVLILLLILGDISKEIWRYVVESQELIDELPHPDERNFNPYLISRNTSGLLEIKKDEDYEDKMPDLSLISTSKSCLYFIFQLMGYIHEQQMHIEEFFFGSELRWSKPIYEPGILFEYFLLLVQRYFELIAAEEDDAQDLYDLSDDDEDQFEEKKKIAQVLLKLLNLASTDFSTNRHILPKLHALIDSVMRQFPDAMCLVVLADFSERGFEELYLDEESSFTGMCSLMNHASFRSKQMLQTLGAFKNFQVLSCFTPERLYRTFACLLKDYCEPHYSETQYKKAIVNVCAFLMKTLPNEAAFEAINQLFTELEKPAEMVPLILEAILTIESEHLRAIVESPEFPIHPVESLKRIADNLTDNLTRKYDFWRIELKKLCPGKKLVAPLTAISEKSFVAGIIFERIFYKSLFDSKRKLEDVFDESVCILLQSVIDHSKILDGCKEAPEELRLRQELRALTGKFTSGILMSSGCGNKTTISAALEHLRKYHQRIYEDRQTEWRAGGVALQCWESRFDYDSDSNAQFPRYQRLTSELNQIDAVMSQLQKHSGSKLLKDVQDENTKKIESVNAQIKVFDDQKRRMKLEHTRLLQEAKKSILDRLFGAQE